VRGAMERFRRRRWGVVAASVPLAAVASLVGAPTAHARPLTSPAGTVRAAVLAPSSAWAIVATQTRAGTGAMGPSTHCEVRRVLRPSFAWLAVPTSQGRKKPAFTPVSRCSNAGTGALGLCLPAQLAEGSQASRAALSISAWR